jgi:hypothetical protein
MENKEQNIGMTSDQDYPISIREFMWEEFCKKFPNQETTNLSLFQVFKLGFRSGASWQSSQPINSRWVSVETELPEIDEAVELVTEYLMSGKLCSHRFIGYMNEYGELYSLPEGDSYGWQFNDCVTMWRYLSELPQPPKQ